jgi:hypothetical protein
MTATMTTPTDQLINTATLLRGRVYVYKGVTFERGVPVTVPDDLGAELEDMFDEVRDSDNEIIEKPLFSVLYDVVPPAPAASLAPRRRRVQPANVRSAPAVAEPEPEEQAPRIRRRPRGSVSRA